MADKKFSEIDAAIAAPAATNSFLGVVAGADVLYTGTQVTAMIAALLGNVKSAVATPAGGSTTARLVFGTTAGFGIYYGSGAPTVSAGKGSWYMRSDGSTINDRFYINTDGGTTWTAGVTAG